MTANKITSETSKLNTVNTIISTESTTIKTAEDKLNEDVKAYKDAVAADANKPDSHS